MKYLHILIALLFLLFAGWQLNDPDWPLWVPMYGSVALVAGWWAVGRPPRLLVLGVLLIAAGWMLSYVPDLLTWIGEGMPTIAGQMKAESPHIELTREFFGLFLCSATLGGYAYNARK